MRYFLLIVLAPYLFLSLASVSFAGSGNHGGDDVLITFLKAQPLAAEMVRFYGDEYATDSMSNDTFRTWFAQNADALTLDVAESPLESTEEELGHNAMTALVLRAPIKLSLPSLRNQRLNKVQAAALLIHESMHHLGISDEMFAYFGAARISEHWERTHPRSSEPILLPLNSPSGFGTASFLTTVMMDHETFVWNGEDSAFIYSPGKNTWRRVSSAGHLSPRLNPVALWTGKEVLLWGGVDFPNFSASGMRTDGALYNPKTNSWRPISSVDAPEQIRRYMNLNHHTQAIWTGSEMIIAGGCFKEDGPVNSNTCVFAPTKRYNPELDRWQTASSGNHPQFYKKQVFWTSETGNADTSNKMIVVGVNNDDIFKHQIFFYSPSENRWSSKLLPTGNFLFEHIELEPIAVWANNKLIVFSHSRSVNSAVVPSVVMAVFDAASHQMSSTNLGGNKFAPRNTNFSCIAAGDHVWIQSYREKVGYLLDPNNLRWRIFDLDRPEMDYIEDFDLGSWTSITWTGESILNMGSDDNGGRIGTIIELQD